MTHATDWQSIETAPKDGTEVLIACPEASNIFIGAFRTWYSDTLRGDVTGWWSNGAKNSYQPEQLLLKPTYWMPLPELPNATVFADAEKHILSGCENYLEIVPGREHHAKWFKTLNHPDANLIAAAPDLFAALLKIAATENREFGSDWEEIEEARQIANDAIKLVTGER